MSLEQVAKRARVSTATVSRVLNGVDVVKSSTRARVMKAVTELKYHPNLHARSLAGGRSRTVGVIVSNLDNPFFVDVYRAVETDCHARGYELVVANTLYRSEQLAASVRMMLGRRVAGLAVIVSEMDDDIITELTENEIPIVFSARRAGTSRKSASTIAKGWSASPSTSSLSATSISRLLDITQFSARLTKGGGH
jgi:DNA-binding LacI/PurR family transcriptional regulator